MGACIAMTRFARPTHDQILRVEKSFGNSIGRYTNTHPNCAKTDKSRLFNLIFSITPGRTNCNITRYSPLQIIGATCLNFLHTILGSIFDVFSEKAIIIISLTPFIVLLSNHVPSMLIPAPPSPVSICLHHCFLSRYIDVVHVFYRHIFSSRPVVHRLIGLPDTV